MSSFLFEIKVLLSESLELANDIAKKERKTFVKYTSSRLIEIVEFLQ